MKNFAYFFVGIVLLIVGAVVYYKLGEPNSISINGVVNQSKAVSSIAQLAIGGGLCALGLLFFLLGIAGNRNARKLREQIAHIMATGIATEGTVTFVDKNYYVLVNNKPIYSIVEYTYYDSKQVQYTQKIDNVSSDLVIRNNIQVGGKVNIKYAAEDSSKSTILL